MVSLSYISDSADHIATPLADSYVKVNGGDPASLLHEGDYPVAAECQVCHERIMLQTTTQMEWRHDPARQAVPAAGAL